MDKQERRQDHFNKAYLGVIAQGQPATTFSSFASIALRCVYLSDDGSKCNVGHILTDEELKKFGHVMGGVGDLWTYMYETGDADHDHPFNSDSTFYYDLQSIHDNLMEYSGSEFVSFFRHNMKGFAQRYGLEVPDETATA